MSLSKCASCNSKKLRFTKIQEASGLKTPLSKISLLGDILFWRNKTNDIVNKFLLPGDKFMPYMHLKQPRFTHCVCFITKHK